jgi:hypothetical protein
VFAFLWVRDFTRKQGKYQTKRPLCIFNLHLHDPFFLHRRSPRRKYYHAVRRTSMQAIEFISDCEVGAGGDEDNPERAAQI